MSSCSGPVASAASPTAKPSERESWNGAIVRLARASDVATPTHDFIYRMLLEKRARGELTFLA